VSAELPVTAIESPLRSDRRSGSPRSGGRVPSAATDVLRRHGLADLVVRVDERPHRVGRARRLALHGELAAAGAPEG
jgi:hypothetical protein